MYNCVTSEQSRRSNIIELLLSCVQHASCCSIYCRYQDLHNNIKTQDVKVSAAGVQSLLQLFQDNIIRTTGNAIVC